MSRQIPDERVDELVEKARDWAPSRERLQAGRARLLGPPGPGGGGPPPEAAPRPIPAAWVGALSAAALMGLAAWLWLRSPTAPPSPDAVADAHPTEVVAANAGPTPVPAARSEPTHAAASPAARTPSDPTDSTDSTPSATPADSTLSLPPPARPSPRTPRRRVAPGGPASAPTPTEPTLPEGTAPETIEPPSASPPSELELVRNARAALRRRPAQTLALARSHAALYPRGVLVEEREVLAIEALVALGRSRAAQARANRFDQDYPRSPHRERIRRALANPG